MKKICVSYVLTLLWIIVLFSCKKNDVPAPLPTPPVNPSTSVLLKDVIIPSLPSPYYHFEYNADGKPNAASFASGLYNYDIVYANNRISEMKSSLPSINFKLQYTYNEAGQVCMIGYVNSGGEINKRVFFTYNRQQLFEAERQIKTDSGFITEKKTFFFYRADGNLIEMLVHRLSIPALAQPEAVYSDWYDQFDDKISPDDFSLLHEDFFDHLILLPGVQFRKNNPLRVTHTGDGVEYRIDFSYTYNDKNAPLIRTGNLQWFSGADSGKKFEEKAFYSYY